CARDFSSWKGRVYW
nr:immunoglobulin heavy chain junction region [Macaca mulatta]MOV89303.1 immunoglobulin heavy chain junction region [Macaca mulatta]MOV89429.1 immunoglobulin heavy chain junction region [Macaca mulatta]MOV90834.1 immunoglobulin heavy chain junction region [Macaca mulatta]